MGPRGWCIRLLLLRPPKLPRKGFWNPGPGTQLPSPGVSIHTRGPAWRPLGVGCLGRALGPRAQGCSRPVLSSVKCFLRLSPETNEQMRAYPKAYSRHSVSGMLPLQLRANVPHLHTHTVILFAYSPHLPRPEHSRPPRNKHQINHGVYAQPSFSGAMGFWCSRFKERKLRPGWRRGPHKVTRSRQQRKVPGSHCVPCGPIDKTKHVSKALSQR